MAFTNWQFTFTLHFFLKKKSKLVLIWEISYLNEKDLINPTYMTYYMFRRSGSLT